MLLWDLADVQLGKSLHHTVSVAGDAFVMAPLECYPSMKRKILKTGLGKQQIEKCCVIEAVARRFLNMGIFSHNQIGLHV